MNPPSAQRWMQIAWPAFLAAGALEMLVFSTIDPHDIHWLGQPVQWSREAVYTLAFFMFWAVTAASSALTMMLARPPLEAGSDAGRKPSA
jgi:hypothetical protein